LRGVLPYRAQVGVGNRLAGNEPVGHRLVESIAELDHNVIDHVRQPRIVEEHLQDVVVVLQAV
jgi:Ni,Fe-hydrogenase maturation factor